MNVLLSSLIRYNQGKLRHAISNSDSALERVTFNHSVSQSNILGPNGPGNATVKLDTV
ncbi:hypothetical protein Pan161_11330 [Gimesia algae]|uniref:Uncharacterized protein n=1 Tax=Gimesia algae TaxID=2527971 RepID=A0A517V920_9PLAN|nr:hypothetical protein Pan161_11330 [Gimesia algae]